MSSFVTSTRPPSVAENAELSVDPRWKNYSSFDTEADRNPIDCQCHVISVVWEIPETSYQSAIELAAERQIDVSTLVHEAIDRETQVAAIGNLHLEVRSASLDRLHEMRRQQCSSLGVVWRAIALAPDPTSAESAELASIWERYLHQLRARKALCQRAIGLITQAIDKLEVQPPQTWQDDLEDAS